MNENEYPNYFQAADSKSIESQKSYIKLYKIDLWALVISAILFSIGFNSAYKTAIYVIVTFLLFCGAICTIVLKTKKFDILWYQSRALAESCKTITWRYITCSEDFNNKLTSVEVDELFKNRVEQACAEYKDLLKELDPKLTCTNYITKKMHEIRNFKLRQRIDFYFEKRICDQKNWYIKKSDENKLKASFWFYIIIISQILAFLSALFSIFFPNIIINLVSIWHKLNKVDRLAC